MDPTRRSSSRRSSSSSGDGGLANVLARLDAIPAAVRAAADAAVLAGGKQMADDMKTLAYASKRTGRLIDSITITKGGETTPPYSQPGGSTKVRPGAVMITTGNSDVRYPHLVEYGTSHSAAQPFFWPAARANNKRIKSRISRAIRKAVRDNWGK